MTGYQLTKGYWNNPEKTNETLTTDENGVTWLKTGDEALFTPEGYCSITGRFKDIIIRGEHNSKYPSNYRTNNRAQAEKTSTPSKSKSA